MPEYAAPEFAAPLLPTRRDRELDVVELGERERRGHHAAHCAHTSRPAPSYQRPTGTRIARVRDGDAYVGAVGVPVHARRPLFHRLATVSAILVDQPVGPSAYGGRYRVRMVAPAAVHEDDLANAINDVGSPVVVGISGFGGSGKSTLATWLAQTVPGCVRVRGDDFLDPARVSRSIP